MSLIPYVHGSKAKIYLNGIDVSPYLRNVQTPHTVDTAETSTFGHTFKTYVPGLVDGSISCDGIYDGEVGAIDELLTAALENTSLDIFTVSVQGEVLGSPAFGFASTTTSYQVTAGIGDVAQVTVQGQNNMGLERGIILHPMAQETVDSGGTPPFVDQVVASTTTGWSAYMQIPQAASTMSSLKIQDSGDNVTYVDLAGATFTPLTTLTGLRIVSAPGALVRRYVRVTWDLTTSATFQVIFIRGGKPVS